MMCDYGSRLILWSRKAVWLQYQKIFNTEASHLAFIQIVSIDLAALQKLRAMGGPKGKAGGHREGANKKQIYRLQCGCGDRFIGTAVVECE
jgi:hypothetical protein